MSLGGSHVNCPPLSWFRLKYAGSCLVHTRPGWLMLVKIFLYTDTSTFIKLGLKKLLFTIHSQSNDGCNCKGVSEISV